MPDQNSVQERLSALKKEYQDIGIFFDFVDSDPIEKAKLAPGEYDSKIAREAEINVEIKALMAK